MTTAIIYNITTNKLFLIKLGTSRLEKLFESTQNNYVIIGMFRALK